MIYLLNIIILLGNLSHSENKDWTDNFGNSFVFVSQTLDEEPNSSKLKQKGFWISKYEITQETWVKIMGRNPSLQKGLKHPVENVSWTDIQLFIHKLNMAQSKWVYRLPTLNEWRIAADPKKNQIMDCSTLCRFAWTRINAGKKHHKVGLLKPNGNNLFDTLGNVMEWCQDSYSPNSFETRVGLNDKVKNWKVYIGGHFHSDPGLCNTENPIGFDPEYHSIFLGFRLACDLRES